MALFIAIDWSMVYGGTQIMYRTASFFSRTFDSISRSTWNLLGKATMSLFCSSFSPISSLTHRGGSSEAIAVCSPALSNKWVSVSLRRTLAAHATYDTEIALNLFCAIHLLVGTFLGVSLTIAWAQGLSVEGCSGDVRMLCNDCAYNRSRLAGQEYTVVQNRACSASKIEPLSFNLWIRHWNDSGVWSLYDSNKHTQSV